MHPIEDRRSQKLCGSFEHLSRGRRLTAALSDVFEAKLVFSTNVAVLFFEMRRSLPSDGRW
jgi:hypothetical protein